MIEVDGDRITGLHHFLDPELFAAFGLPPHLTDDDADATDGGASADDPG